MSSIAGDTARSLSSHLTGNISVRSLYRWPIGHWEGLWVVVILLITMLAHGINMFQFPYYETDEGTYMSQAWAVVEQGRLAPYTYIYDHAPLGWLLVAVWTIGTGGFDTFGMTVESGRMLMLLLQVGSTFMLYRIARNLTGSVTVASVVALLFALSAYGILYHRRVLLDNIATFWMLLSIMLLTSGRSSLNRVWLSACALGVSILSKEVAICLVPVLACLVFFRVHRSQRWFAVIGWTAIVGAIVSGYLLLAILKSELFPSGWLPGDNTEHVSLIETLLWQVSREKDGGLIEFGSKFWQLFGIWVRDEPLLVVGGTLSALVSLLTIRRRPLLGLMGAAIFALWFFLGRGGEVLPFYMVPLLPLLALNVGFALDWGIRKAKAAFNNGGCHYYFRQAVANSVRLTIAGLCLSSILVGYSSPNLGRETQFPDTASGEEANPVASTGYFLGSTLWRSQQTIAQKRALEWIKANISSDSTLIIDNYMWTDLHEEGNGENGYWRAHWYWKVDRDPEIKQDLFQEDWRYADYIVTTRQLLTDSEVAGLELVNQVLISSTPVAHFNSDGWPVEIRRVDKPQQLPASADPILARTWDGYKERFIQDGRVIDPKAYEQTTSEGQSYAMLRAVYMDDRRAFDEVWGWTKMNLGKRVDGLLAWQWGTLPDGTQGIIDQNSASDADTDAALALLFAAQQWDAPEYEQEAREILRGIWEQETVVVDGRRVVVAGNWAGGGSDEESGRAVVNPSYFAPYAYRIFAEADPERQWMDLVDSSYQVLAQVRENPTLGGEVGLIPDWLVLASDTGELLPADELGPRAEEFSYDASRLPWRLSLDWLWFGDPRAKEAIVGLDFLRKELERDGSLLAAYKTDGRPAIDEEATSMYAGIVPGLLLGENPDLANRVFAEKILGQYMDVSQYPYWGDDPENYYNQNMAWFATAIMDGGMSNLWKGATVIDWRNVAVRGCTSQCAAARKESIFKDTRVGG